MTSLGGRLRPLLLAVISCILFLIHPPDGLSSYLIRLKDGAEFITCNYWDEGGAIKFDLYGGIVGFPKEYVLEIRTSDLPCPRMDQPAEQQERDQKDATKRSLSKQNLKTGAEDSPNRAFLEEKTRIMTEIRDARDAFREAKAKNNEEQVQAERKRMLSLRTELSRLLKKVKDAHGGQVPAWWDSEM